MSEIRVRVPREMREWLEEEAKRMGWTVTGLALLALWERKERTESGVIEDKKRTNRGVRAAKFKPPSYAEAEAERVGKGYHINSRAFVAWNQARGWKTKQGPMKDWKAAMATWEENWRERKEEEEKEETGQAGTQEYDTSGNRELVEALKERKGW